MKSYFRIWLVCMVMLGITISSFAGVKKCNKRPKQNKYVISTIQQPDNRAHHENEKSAGKEICITINPLIYKEEVEEKQLYVSLNEKLIIPYSSFYLQGYSNPPFAPPRS